MKSASPQMVCAPAFARRNKGCGHAAFLLEEGRKTQDCASCHSRIEPHNRLMANPVNELLSRTPTSSENIGALSPSAVKLMVPLSPALVKVQSPTNSPARLDASSSMPSRLKGD